MFKLFLNPEKEKKLINNLFNNLKGSNNDNLKVKRL
ncbi:hypothetical protein LCGC14_1431570 [marine sediment metagenome]|uniref:Uncharacterized protein n=1 Tax=marine sediment metagenome TaxID=412755 RepID=A0A0F9MQ70_9ZZZZ